MLAGQQDYIENSALLSAVQAVAAATRLRQIRGRAHEAVRSYRAHRSSGPWQEADGARGTRTSRRLLENLADELSELELELSFAVEATADLGMLVQSLRTEQYHATLFEQMDLIGSAQTVSRMLDRLERSIAAELTSVVSHERRADELQRLRWALAAGVLSTTAIPLTLIFAFFGINAREVDGNRSLFDPHDTWVYLVIGAVLAISVLVVAAHYLRQWLTSRRGRAAAAGSSRVAGRRGRRRPRCTGRCAR